MLNRAATEVPRNSGHPRTSPADVSGAHDKDATPQLGLNAHQLTSLRLDPPDTYPKDVHSGRRCGSVAGLSATHYRSVVAFLRVGTVTSGAVRGRLGAAVDISVKVHEPTPCGSRGYPWQNS